MGFGFVVARFGLFLREIGTAAAVTPLHSTGFSLWTGTALVLAGVIVNAVSTAQYLHIIRELKQGRDVTNRASTLAVAMAAVLSVVGVAMAVYLLVMR
jgi:putative membrane protein